jgi:hypothetical protein
MIIGGLLGAVGAGGLARGYNLVRGEAAPVVRWSEDFFLSLVRLALLRYLAVAHFGRGRGDYTESEHPDFWQAAVAETVERHRTELRSAWERAKSADAAVSAAPLKKTLTSATAELLVRFYPEAAGLFSRGSETTEAASPGGRTPST